MCAGPFCWEQARALLREKPKMDASGVRLIALSVGAH